MTLAPGIRLLWLVGAGGVIGASAAALNPSIRPAAAALLLAALGIVLADAYFARRRLAGVSCLIPEVTRSYQHREQTIEMQVVVGPFVGSRLRVALQFPAELGGDVDEQTLVPEPAGGAVQWRFTPRRRGRYPLRLAACECSSPLGLWDVRRRFALNGEARVYPNLRSAGELAALRTATGGMKPVRQVGKGKEFEKLREYAPGDSFDEIHWKAAARRRVPVTKVFQVERTQEVYLIVDGSRLSARQAGGESLLDQYLAASLLLAGAAEGHGDLFGLAIFANQVHTFVRARRGKAHFAACREAIYQAQPLRHSANFRETSSFLMSQLHRRSLVMFLGNFDDPLTAAEFLEVSRLLGRKHLVAAACVRPAGAAPLFGNASADDLHAELAGHLQWRGLRELELALRARGIRLALLEPGRMYAGLLGLYEDVKHRQLL